jgi:hypothetical protein
MPLPRAAPACPIPARRPSGEAELSHLVEKEEENAGGKRRPTGCAQRIEAGGGERLHLAAERAEWGDQPDAQDREEREDHRRPDADDQPQDHRGRRDPDLDLHGEESGEQAREDPLNG